jgi:outer membrane murein-binding lipoprotein Lpp
MRARSRTTYLLGTVVLTGLLLAGCGSDDSQNSAGMSAADAPAVGEVAPQVGEAQKAEGADTAAKAPDLRVDQRSIIYRGTITVRVENVDAAAGQATGVAKTAGGFVSGDNRSSGSGADTATMELRVPADKFGATVDQLSKLGTEEQRQISTEDVTEQTIDLDARITVQQARVDSGRKLLAQAKSLNDLVMLEREVATREADLASLQAKKRNLADLTALSTITVTLLDPEADAVVEQGPPGFLSGLGAGWDALLASLKVLLTVLGALLPWLIAFGLPIWGIVYAVRRYNRTRRAARPAPAFAHQPPPAVQPPVSGPPADQDQP